MRGRRLWTQTLVTQVTVLLVTLLVGTVLVALYLRRELDQQFESRALSVAHTVASVESVRDALAAGDPNGRIRLFAEQVRRATGSTYVVVADRSGIRYSHPNPRLIGRRVSTEPTPVRTGRDWTGVQTGTLGRSARGKVPVFDDAGRVIGEVSVGILEARVADRLRDELPTIGLYLLAALGVGVLAAGVLARRLKRQTFGLELDELAGLLQEREAVLYGITEGLLATDSEGIVRVVNDPARRLLGLSATAVGRPLAEVLASGGLSAALAGSSAVARDVPVVVGDRVLTLNRMPVRLSGRDAGAVVTVRDHTEADTLSRELAAVRGLTDALRAQAHEFSNRLHTIVGLIEIGEPDQAASFAAELSLVDNALCERLLQRLPDPIIVALVLAKHATAAERGVSLRLSDDSAVTGRVRNGHDVVTVVGNLLDNAVDAAASGTRRPAEVRLRLWSAGEDLHVAVGDTGAGVPEQARTAVFADGWTTKGGGACDPRRGLGLSLVRQVVERSGGRVAVAQEPGGGACFTARLPGALVGTRAGETADPVGVPP